MTGGTFSGLFLAKVLSDTFIIDVKGDVGLGFDFNVQQLGNFVNEVTLPPNNGIDGLGLGKDLIFDALGAGIGIIDFKKPLKAFGAGFIASAAESLFDTFSEQNQIEQEINAQKERAKNAIEKYDDNWGSVFVEGNRDTVNIEDFQIGIDRIFLPQLPNSNDRYEVATTPGENGGAALFILGDSGIEDRKKIGFIKNNYSSFGMTDNEFADIVGDLINGSTVGVFRKTVVTGNSSDNRIFEGSGGKNTSYANDNVKAGGRNDLVVGWFGDDVIQLFNTRIS